MCIHARLRVCCLLRPWALGGQGRLQVLQPGAVAQWVWGWLLRGGGGRRRQRGLHATMHERLLLLLLLLPRLRLGLRALCVRLRLRLRLRLLLGLGLGLGLRRVGSPVVLYSPAFARVPLLLRRLCAPLLKRELAPAPSGGRQRRLLALEAGDCTLRGRGHQALHQHRHGCLRAHRGSNSPCTRCVRAPVLRVLALVRLLKASEGKVLKGLCSWRSAQRAMELARRFKGLWSWHSAFRGTRAGTAC